MSTPILDDIDDEQVFDQEASDLLEYLIDYGADVSECDEEDADDYWEALDESYMVEVRERAKRNGRLAEQLAASDPEDLLDVLDQVAYLVDWSITVFTPEDLIRAYERAHLEPPLMDEWDQFRDESQWAKWLTSELTMEGMSTMDELFENNQDEDYGDPEPLSTYVETTGSEVYEAELVADDFYDERDIRSDALANSFEHIASLFEDVAFWIKTP